jgi:hypothetical protein
MRKSRNSEKVMYILSGLEPDPGEPIIEPDARKRTRSSTVVGVMSMPDLERAARISVASSRPSPFLSISWKMSHSSRSWSHRNRLFPLHQRPTPRKPQLVKLVDSPPEILPSDPVPLYRLDLGLQLVRPTPQPRLRSTLPTPSNELLLIKPLQPLRPLRTQRGQRILSGEMHPLGRCRTITHVG